MYKIILKGISVNYAANDGINVTFFTCIEKIYIYNSKAETLGARQPFGNYATKFHPDVLWSQCKDNVKWVGNFFYRISLFCFFLEKLRFE